MTLLSRVGGLFGSACGAQGWHGVTMASRTREDGCS